ncbi:hypothetical protein [Romboutsia sp.]|uniref:hypothetical protein n=1 Tax=Romboutsia sp. TaxID=1965302 RepID=UPI002C784719|nr:hypothetical protein [Romboutsia sp.]HSQ89801.1 hypothetical protein [Romboutsia sp.]
MKKSKRLAVTGLTIITLLSGAVATVNHVTALEGELASKNKQIQEFKEVNLQQKSKMDKISNELEEEKVENEVLKCTNSELLQKNSKLEKQVSEKVYPTQIAKNSGSPIKITMTFYGDGASENGGYVGIGAYGNKLVDGTVASNYYPKGTQFTYNGKIYTVMDKGGSNFNGANRLDVFVPRKSGESNRAYKQRLLNLGRQTVTMYRR